MSFRDRYLRSENLTDLEAALQKFQEAVDLTPKGHADKAERLQNLARSFSHRYTKLGDEEDLKAALKYDQEAVDLTPEGHPGEAGRLQQLALSFQEHYVKFKEPSDLSKVHICYRKSFKAPMLNPEAFWIAALEWGSFATEFDPSKCLPPYMTAFKVLPEILWIGHSVDVQHNAIRRLDIGQATSTAVKMCIDLGDLTSAVEIMEQGLATIFQQMLQLKTDVDKLPSEQAEKLKNYSSELYSRKSVNPLALVIERNKLLDHIRGQPGFEDFLCAKKYQALCKAAQGGPIIILSSNEDCCDGIIIPNPTSEPIHVPLPNVTLELLESQRILLKDLLRRCNVRIRGESTSTRIFNGRESFSSKATTECFTDMLLWLWTDIVSPVFESLKSVSENIILSHNLYS
jgi:tetratricopeptide (TPR) repeat protein